MLLVVPMSGQAPARSKSPGGLDTTIVPFSTTIVRSLCAVAVAGDHRTRVNANVVVDGRRAAACGPTNAPESVHALLRKIIKTRGHFPCVVAFHAVEVKSALRTGSRIDSFAGGQYCDIRSHVAVMLRSASQINFVRRRR